MFLTINITPGPASSIQINKFEPSTIVAPVVIGFEASFEPGHPMTQTLSTPPAGTGYDPEFHEITYVWSVSRPLVPYSAPGNMVAGWNDPNTAYGKKVALHFPTPGVFEVSLWAINRQGAQAVGSTTVNVSSADDVFPTTQTVCYSNDVGETWAGEKPGCQRATSFNDLATAITNANAPLRILFKRGQEYPRTEVQRLRFTNAGDYLNHVGTWGSGAKPIIHGLDGLPIFETFNAVHATDWCTFENIDFRGDWDAPSETGVPTYTPFQFFSNDKDTHFTVSQCDFSGFKIIYATPGETASFMGLADCVITNWQDMGVFYHPGASSFVAEIGCRIQQHVDAQNGAPSGEGKNGFYNDHGCSRYGELSHMYIACTDHFSRNGWFDQTDQPCLRMNTDGAAGRSFIIERVVCEGGSDPITISGNNASTPENPGNFLIDRALLIGTAMTFRSFVYAEYGGLTVRNTLGILPNVVPFKTNTWNGSVYMTGELGPGVNEDAPVQVYGNSFVNLQNTTNDPGHAWTSFVDAEGFNAVTNENNIAYGPNLDTPVLPGGSMDISTAISGVTPRYKGVLFNEFGQENGTLAGDVGPGGSFTLPYPAGTDQAYWQALPASDDQHQINVTGSGFFHQSRGQMSVTFEATVVRITNNSAATWGTGSTWALKLDRKSQKSVIPVTYASPSTIPLARPVTAFGAGGLVPYDDFEEAVRGANSIGAVEP